MRADKQQRLEQAIQVLVVVLLIMLLISVGLAFYTIQGSLAAAGAVLGTSSLAIVAYVVPRRIRLVPTREDEQLLALLDESQAASRAQWLTELIATQSGFIISRVDEWYTITSASGTRYLIPHVVIGDLSHKVLEQAAERSVLSAALVGQDQPSTISVRKTWRRSDRARRNDT